MESDLNVWKDKKIKVCENWYIILTTNQFASPQEKKQIKRKIADYQRKHHIGQGKPIATPHFNTKQIDRFSTTKFRSSLNQGVLINLKGSSTRKTKIRKKDSSLTTRRITNFRKEDETESLLHSDFSFESEFAQMKSGKCINPILNKYSSVPQFRLD